MRNSVVCWFVLAHLVACLVDLVSAARRSDPDQDLPILLLQHQVRLLPCQRPQPPRLTRWEKRTLAVLTTKLARLTASPRSRLAYSLPLSKPDTVLRWHRDLVRRKWTRARPHQGLEQRTPLPSTERAGRGPIRRRDLLGGLLREYYHEAA